MVLLTLFDDPQPNRLVEDLGWKQFPMCRARGVQITWLDHENDGDLNGKPTKAWEDGCPTTSASPSSRADHFFSSAGQLVTSVIEADFVRSAVTTTNRCPSVLTS